MSGPQERVKPFDVVAITYFKCYSSIRKKVWGGALRSLSYFAGSGGGAPVEIVRKYIDQQKTPHSPPKGPLRRPRYPSPP
ncbi:transposase [Burkholderia lata]|uniref:transposase n=1 Tax=Burkholderia lata (strain ATCC 17760 / DSM 23089 / LMG 22485 / NCIMB 9086 / R18194 / 383) TaxID=482957 RepID=UPI00399AB687